MTSTSIMKIGYVTLGAADGKLASTRITVLNPMEKIRALGYLPEILDEGTSYDPDRNLEGLVPLALEKGYQQGDIIYFQSMKSISAVRTARLLSEHGIFTVLGICNFIAAEMAEAVDAVIVSSQKLKEHYPHDLQQKIHLIHDGIESPDIKKESYHSKGKLKAVFLTGKRYQSIPGLHLPEDVELTVIGPYDDTPLETFRIPQLTEGYSRFKKEIWTLDAYKRIADFDIGVIPIDLTEPMPRPDQAPTETRSANKLTQMMSAALPLVAGPLPAYKDIITQGNDGFIAHTREDWLSALNLLKDQNYRGLIGRNARKRVELEYSLESQVRKLVSLFNYLRLSHQNLDNIA